jgi:polysaccharide pyruvyl transferase CsaB
MRVFVAAWLGSRNLGDELVFASLRRRLAARGCSIVVASARPSRTEALHGVRAVHHLNLAAVARAIASSDALVFGGGGLLQDGTSPFSLPLHLTRLLLARALRVPFIGVGLGAGPLRRRGSRPLVRLALRRHRGLSVRDEESFRLLSALGVPGATVAADLAFALEPVGARPRDRIVVALRAYAEGLIPSSWHPPRASADVESGLAAALDEVHRRTGLPLRFVAFEGRRDDDLHRRVAGRMATRDVSFATPTLATVLEEIGGGRAVVSMRYHGGVAAVIEGRPLVLLGYVPKVEALSRALGEGCRYLSSEPPGLPRLAAEVEGLLEEPGDLARRRARLRSAERANDALIDGLCRSLEPPVPKRDAGAPV